MLALAWRNLKREIFHGEARVLLIALTLAVASVGSVGLFADRVRQGLSQQANVLLGADVLISGDRALPDTFAEEAKKRGLATTNSVRLGSMVNSVASGNTANAEVSPVLTEVKSVSAGYPLRGSIRVSTPDGGEKTVGGQPAPGEVWIDERLAQRLNLKAGGQAQVGAAALNVALVFKEEPEVAGSFLTMSPKLLLNDADLARTQLVQPGTRASWRVHVAGAGSEAYETWAKAALGAGQRLDTVRELRPEVKSTLERAEQFLAMAALLAVILSAVAVALAIRSYLKRELDNAALMRCLGASRAKVWFLFAAQALMLGTCGAVLGLLGAYLGQFALASAMQYLGSLPLPWPGIGPALRAVAVGFVLIFGFALPPLLALANVSPLKVLRRDLGTGTAWGWLSAIVAFAALIGLAAWQAGNIKIGTTVLGGALALLLISGVVSAGLIALLGRTLGSMSPVMRLGLSNLRRRKWSTGLQLACLSLGVMSLFLLTQVSSDLFDAWRKAMPADAPNRFVINLFPDQRAEASKIISAATGKTPDLFPMVRARLTAINGTAVTADTYTEARAKRLVDREFNLSMGDRLLVGNSIIEGTWHGTSTVLDQLSLEEGIAAALKTKLGDTLTFDFGGASRTLKITSVRKVEWDSFRVNFFAVTPLKTLDEYPSTYITAIRTPKDALALNTALAAKIPNALTIDVGEIVDKVQEIVGQVAKALQFVMLFSLAAGLLVLYAAVATTQDERRYDTAVLRVLGAAREQVRKAALVEFALLGALAGALGALGATATGWAIARRVLDVEYAWSASSWVIGVVGAMIGVLIAGWLGMRKSLDASPLQTIRSIS
jgi:putative ABC transport system permease protein